MPPTGDQYKRIVEQHRRIEMRRHAAEMRDRDIDCPFVELLGGLGAGHRRQPQGRPARLSGKALGEAPDEVEVLDVASVLLRAVGR